MSHANRRFLISAIAAIALSTAVFTGVSAQPSVPASTNLVELIGAAMSKADHEQIATQFEKQAETDKAAAERHRKMSQAYVTAPWAKSSGAAMVKHCKSLSADYEKAAKQNIAMAKMHRELAAKLS